MGGPGEKKDPPLYRRFLFRYTDGFVIGRRDYRVQIREREDLAIPRGIESRDRKEGHVICHRGRSVIRGQSSPVTASRAAFGIVVVIMC